MRYEHGVLHGGRVVGDQVPALQHRLVVGEEPVELHERRDRHDEERVQRAGRHEAGKGSLPEQGQRTTSSLGCRSGRFGDGRWTMRRRVEHDGDRVWQRELQGFFRAWGQESA